MARHTFRGKPYIVAECRDCEWRLVAVNAIGVAARHSDKYDHWVDIDISNSMSFRRDKDLTEEQKAKWS